MNYVDIDNYITNLSYDNKFYLFNRLKSILFNGLSKEITLCPCCNETNFMKHGSYKGTQKFKCRNTSKIFTYRTNTVVSGIAKMDKMIQLVEMLGTGKLPTLTEIQKKLQISRPTAFDWRTKILTALYEEIELSNSTVEFDETYAQVSRKGRRGMSYSRERGKKQVGDNDYNVKIFMSYNRDTKQLELYASHMGRTSSQDVENYLGAKKDFKIVYTDKHKSYIKCFNDNNLPHESFKSSDHVSLKDNEVHNQTINHFSGKLKRFLEDDLKGASTKYLQGYLNWQMFLQNGIKSQIPVQKKVSENKVALEIFKQKEKEFQYFLRNNGRNNYGTYYDRYYGNKPMAKMGI
jgi:transposase-like protein/IS1 family transposase